MTRRLAQLLFLISLLLCIAAAALWVRSHWFQDLWFYQRVGLPSDPGGYKQIGLRSDDGIFSFERDIVGRSPEEKKMGIIEAVQPGVHHLSWRGNVGQNFAGPAMRWHGIPIGYFVDHPQPMVDSFSDPRGVDTSKTSIAVWVPDWLPVTILAFPSFVGFIRWRVSARRRLVRGFDCVTKADIPH